MEEQDQHLLQQEFSPHEFQNQLKINNISKEGIFEKS
jgi:hypothetical protein